MSDSALALPVSEGDPLLRLAIDKNLDIEKLKELIALKRDADREAAEREFHDAMAQFQAECPVIVKNREAVDATRNGGKKLYAYADLAQIDRTVRPIAARHGLSWTWNSEIVDGKMAVTCTVRHRSGHKQSAVFVAVIGGTSIMSESQKAGAAVTFAQRYSLVQALGLSTAEDDIDARDTNPREATGDTITDDQALTLDTMLNDTRSDRAKFLGFFKITRLEDLPASRYGEATGMLNAKARKS